jgi:solute carrier family 15 (oligopeptide transporter), member 1
LFLIALGSGGIKPCVAAFGGEQFKLPEQMKQLTVFFSMFYFSINLGSFISTLVTPLLRSTKCLGEQDCFPLGFGLPAVLMAVSIVIFLAGKALYKILPHQGNMLVKVTKCISVSFILNFFGFFIFLNYFSRTLFRQKDVRRRPTLRSIGWR